MTAAKDIITEGYREMNVIPVGKLPSTAQQIEGLAVLNRYLQSVFGFLMGEVLSDWHIPYSQRTGSVAANAPLYPGSQTPIVTLNPGYPPANRRVVWDGSTQTVYFPDKPSDGARMQLIKGSGASATPGTLTIDGNGNSIEAGATYTTTTGTKRSWLYRADMANWVALEPLLLEDEIPFPFDLDDLWVCAVAVRLSSRYSKTLAAGTTATYKRMLTTLKTRYQQESAEPKGGTELTTSDQTYGGSWMDSLP